MSSDNGKPGEIDWYDVWKVAEYIERKYQATVEINFSSALEGSRTRMLLCASIVGNGHSLPAGCAGSAAVSFSPGPMRNVPKVAYELLLEVQEEFDDLMPGALSILEPKF